MKSGLQLVSVALLLCACSAPRTAGVKPVKEERAEVPQASTQTPVSEGLIKKSDLDRWPFYPPSEEDPHPFNTHLPPVTSAVMELLKSPLPELPLPSSVLESVKEISVSYALADCSNLAGQTIDVPFRVAEDLTAFACPAGAACDIAEREDADPQNLDPDGEPITQSVKTVRFAMALPVYRLSGTEVEEYEVEGLIQTSGDSMCGGTETDAEFQPRDLKIEKRDVFIASARAQTPTVQEVPLAVESLQEVLASPSNNGTFVPLEASSHKASYKLVDLNADQVPDVYIGNFQAGGKWDEHDGVLIALNVNKAWVVTHWVGPSKQCDPDC